MDEQTAGDLYIIIGHKIRSARKANRITQSQLAELIGVTRTSITNLESGNQRPPLNTLFSIAEVLDIAIFDLIPNTVNGLDETARAMRLKSLRDEANDLAIEITRLEARQNEINEQLD